MAKTIYRTSDISGIADFGSVQPGDYPYLITRVWPKGDFGTAGQLNVGPGSQVQKSIVCPKAPPERATVRVRCSWPADLQRQQLVLYAPFAFRYRKLEPGLEWTLAIRLSRRMTRRSNPDMMFKRLGVNPCNGSRHSFRSVRSGDWSRDPQVQGPFPLDLRPGRFGSSGEEWSWSRNKWRQQA